MDNVCLNDRMREYICFGLYVKYCSDEYALTHKQPNNPFRIRVDKKALNIEM